jgi:hypothetical protein
MAWAVEIFFDEPGEGRVRFLWNTLRLPEADATLYEEGSRPHLSLAVLSSQDGTLEKKAAAVAGRTAPFGLVFGGIGAFPETGTLYLRPEPSGALQALYRDMLAELGTLRGGSGPSISRPMDAPRHSGDGAGGGFRPRRAAESRESVHALRRPVPVAGGGQIPSGG